MYIFKYIIHVLYKHPISIETRNFIFIFLLRFIIFVFVYIPVHCRPKT